MKKLAFILSCLGLLQFTVCHSNDLEYITDTDDNTYQVVSIGNQVWMAENLRVSKYSDGSTIPGNLDNNEWTHTSKGAYGVYPYSKVDGLDTPKEVVDAYGKLYNWFAVDDPRGLCPEGWRVPTLDDWKELTEYISGGIDHGGGQLKSCRQMDSAIGGDCETKEHPRWDARGTYFDEDFGVIGNHEHTDEYMFAALPGGYRTSTGHYKHVGEYAFWWTSSADSDTKGWCQFVFCHLSEIFKMPSIKQQGKSIRCIKDSN